MFLLNKLLLLDLEGPSIEFYFNSITIDRPTDNNEKLKIKTLIEKLMKLKTSDSMID